MISFYFLFNTLIQINFKVFSFVLLALLTCKDRNLKEFVFIPTGPAGFFCGSKCFLCVWGEEDGWGELKGEIFYCRSLNSDTCHNLSTWSRGKCYS